MNKTFANYQKQKDFLVCVDSDGCAMDTMEIKHRACFAPQSIKIWELEGYAEEVTELWHHINLYSQTRGINRFKGLAKALGQLQTKGIEIPDVESLMRWVEEASELSNPALEEAIQKTESACLKQTLKWSYEVNLAIQNLPTDDEPFKNVKEGLAYLSQVTDVSVVSSANGEALEDEWNRHDLKQYIQLLLGQEAGSKSACIKELVQKGYKAHQVLMVGDALGDLEAAKNNGVYFFPILVGKEAQSWKRLYTEAIEKLINGTFDQAYQELLIEEMQAILS